MDLIEIVKKHDLKGLKENLKFSNINECDKNKNTPGNNVYKFPGVFFMINLIHGK